MQVNTKMLLESIKRHENVVLLGPERPDISLQFPCFYNGDAEHLMTGGVYLTLSDNVPETDKQIL